MITLEDLTITFVLGMSAGVVLSMVIYMVMAGLRKNDD